MKQKLCQSSCFVNVMCVMQVEGILHVNETCVKKGIKTECNIKFQCNMRNAGQTNIKSQ